MTEIVPDEVVRLIDNIIVRTAMHGRAVLEGHEPKMRDGWLKQQQAKRDLLVYLKIEHWFIKYVEELEEMSE